MQDDGLTELFEQEPKQGRALILPSPIALTGFLFVFACATLFIATQIFWELPWANSTRQIFFCVLIGMLLSLPILPSLWMAFGAQTWIIRLPLAFGTLLGLLAFYLATISIQSSSLSIENYWLISAITLAVALAIQIPAWIIRVSKRVRISRQGAVSSSDSQFSIKHLLIATTIIALLLPLLQWFATLGVPSMMLGRMGRQIIGFCSIFILVLAFLTLLSVLIVFLPKLRIWSWSLLAIGILALPWAVVPSIIFVFNAPSVTATEMIDMGLNVMAFSASNALTMIVVLFMYYAIGFRLRSSAE